MLGPLEAVHAERVLPLGGTKQRATLGFLLLHANEVVATSRLLRALWAEDNAPTSARKMLQNAVWGLRGALDVDGDSTRLTTQAPGYMLQIDDDQVDLFRFHRLAAKARGALAAGNPQEAGRLLRDALSLWHGPALADLIESGFVWPKLTSVQNARLDAMEDCFEADLACGRHQAVLGELEAMVEAEPLRERSCGQLMLALYRCGRQADALSVYARVRAALVEGLGLEPGHELQRMQHAILVHDASLNLPEPRLSLEQPAGRAQRPVTTPARAEPRWLESWADGDPVVPTPRNETAAKRRDVTAVLVRTQCEAQPVGAEPERVDRLLESVCALISQEAERFDGVVAASIGSVCLVVLGARDEDDHDPVRAVRAAMAMRRRLVTPTDVPSRTTGAGPGLAVRIAVATGPALVRESVEAGGDVLSVNGALLDEAQALLARVAAGRIYVCDRTRQLTEHAVQFRRADDSTMGWQVERLRQQDSHFTPGMPIVDRERELELLRGLLDRASHRARPHLVTVLGEPGIGKTRFVHEFERRVSVNAETARFLVGRARPAAGDDALSVPGEILLSCCGITQDDLRDAMTDKLDQTLQRLPIGDDERDWMRHRLGCLVGSEAGVRPGIGIYEVLLAWRRFLEAVAIDRPLVVVIDDLQWANDVLLTFVEDMAEAARSVPLLVIVAARPELLARRPDWGGGKRHSATITLDAPSGEAINRLLEYLESTTMPSKC